MGSRDYTPPAEEAAGVLEGRAWEKKKEVNSTWEGAKGMGAWMGEDLWVTGQHPRRGLLPRI